MSLLEGLARLAAADGFGVWSTDAAYGEDDTAIMVGVVPSTPDRAVVVTLYAGPEADSKLAYDEPSVQVRARAGPGEFTTSLDLAQDIYDTWHGRGPLDLPTGEHVLSMIGVQSGPIALGLDDTGRYEHTINFRVEYRRPHTHRS